MSGAAGKPHWWAEVRMFLAEQCIGLALRIMPENHPRDAIWQECIYLATLRMQAFANEQTEQQGRRDWP